MPERKVPSRYLPTLTEVIDPEQDPTARGTFSAAAALDAATIAEAMQPELARALHKILQELVTAQLARLQPELDLAVRQAVEQAVQAALQPHSAGVATDRRTSNNSVE